MGAGGGKKTVSVATAVWHGVRHAVGEEKGIFFAFKSIFGGIKKTIGFAKQLYDNTVGWVKDQLKPVWDIVKPIKETYDNYVKPVLTDIQTALQDVKLIVNTVRGDVDAILAQLDQEVFGPIKDLQNKIKSLSESVASVVSLVDQKMADKLEAFGQQIDGKFTAWWDKTVNAIESKVADVTETINSKIWAIQAVLDEKTSALDKAFEGLESLTGTNLAPIGSLKPLSVANTESLHGELLLRLHLYTETLNSYIPAEPPSEDEFTIENGLKLFIGALEELGKEVKMFAKQFETEWGQLAKEAHGGI